MAAKRPPEDIGPAAPSGVPQGTRPLGTPSGPRIPRRVAWLALPGDYAELRLLAWINYPQRLALELQSGDQARADAALRQIVLEHNGWLDADGAPLPPAGTEGFWLSDAISTELAACVLAAIQVEALRLPNSLAQTRRS